MKTIKDDVTRKKFFDFVIENHNQGYDEIVKWQLSRISKTDLIRFVNYLHHYHYLYIDINGAGEFDLFASR